MTATPWTTSDFAVSRDVLGSSAAANVMHATDLATGQVCTFTRSQLLAP